MPHVSCISAFKTRLKSRSILWVTMFFSIQVLPPFPRLSPFDLRQRFGLHDDVKAEVKIVISFFFVRWDFPQFNCHLQGGAGSVRHCNWVRFLRLSLSMDHTVNIVGTKTSTGEPLFEVGH